MSPQNSDRLFAAICNLDQYLRDRANADEGDLSPNAFLESLKTPLAADGSLSRLGNIVNLAVGGDNLNKVRWITFHIDLPSENIPNQKFSRNWISVRCSGQKLLDAVHEPVLVQDNAYISTIYAPSVVANKLKTSHGSGKALLAKWWLYCLEDESLSRVNAGACGDQIQIIGEAVRPDLLCFSESPDGQVRMHSCGRGSGPDDQYMPSTLGMALNVAERDALRGFRAYKDIIVDRAASEFPSLGTSEEKLRCNYYARIPMYMRGHGPKDKFETDVFVAFHFPEGNPADVASLLMLLEPPLRLVVAIINGNAAYSYGYQSGELYTERMIRRIIGHGLGNISLAFFQNVKNGFYKRAKIDASILALLAYGLQNYGTTATVQIGEIDTMFRNICTDTSISFSVEGDIDDNLSFSHGSILYIALSELLLNAKKHSPELKGDASPSIGIRILRIENSPVIEVTNIGQIPSHLLENNMTHLDISKCRKDDGLYMICELISQAGGKLVISQESVSVYARLFLPIA